MIKPETIYRYNPAKSFSLSERDAFGNTDTKTPVEAYFIHAQCVGYMNRVEYKPRKVKSVRNKKSVVLVYFVPDEGAKHKQIAPIIERGRRFFTERDGFLWGAKSELNKLGKFVVIENY